MHLQIVNHILPTGKGQTLFGTVTQHFVMISELKLLVHNMAENIK